MTGLFSFHVKTDDSSGPSFTLFNSVGNKVSREIRTPGYKDFKVLISWEIKTFRVLISREIKT